MSEKQWNFALPEDNNIFKAMSDILYTYLYSISKHNPYKKNGVYMENYNYIFLDKRPNGEPRYSHKDTMERLGMAKTTYYRRFNKLLELGLIEKIERRGRKLLIIPFVESKRILDVKTCNFLASLHKDLNFVPDDIIKVLCLLKIYYYSNDKNFTINMLKANLGYSTDNSQKDNYVLNLLTILRGFSLIEFSGRTIERGAVIQNIFTVEYVNDKFNERMDWYDAAAMDNFNENVLDRLVPLK